jgi:hypothetical protein
VAALHQPGLEVGAHGLVDVVAQVQEEVQVGLVGHQVLVAGPVVDAPVLAGDEGEAQLVQRAVLAAAVLKRPTLERTVPAVNW